MKGGLELIKDEIGPQLRATISCTPKSLRTAVERASSMVGKVIKRAWYAGQMGGFKALAISTIIQKTRLGVSLPFIPLRRFHHLHRRVMMTERFVTGRMMGKHKAMISYDWGSQFRPVPYLGYHETGHGVPERSFLIESAKEVSEAFDSAGAGLAVPVEVLKARRPEMKARPKIGKLPAPLFWLPLGFIYKYMGMLSDIHGVLQGTLLKPTAYKAYLEAYFLGRAKGPTKKRVRRIIRRKVWGGV